MTPSQIDNAAVVEAFARALDILTSTGGVRPDKDGDTSLLEAAAAVAVLDGHSEPSAAFAAELGQRLARVSASTTQADAPIGHPEPRPPSLVGTVASPRPVCQRPQPAWRGVAELGMIAAMIVAVLGSILLTSGFGLVGGGGSSSSNEAVGMDRGDAARTGSYGDPGPGDRLAVLWRLGTQERTGSEDGLGFLAPVVAGDAVYALDALHGTVTRYNPAKGPAAVSGGYGVIDGTNIAVAGDLVYLATAGSTVFSGGDLGYLIALDATTLAERWRAPTGGVIRSPIAVSDGRVYVVAVGGVLLAFDAETGAERLRTTLDLGFGPVGNAVADGTVYVSSDAFTLQAVDARTGDVRWSFAAPGRLGNPVVSGDGVYVVARDGGENGHPGQGALVRLDAATGVERWRHGLLAWDDDLFGVADMSASLVPTVDDEHVYLVGDGPTGADVTAVDVADGQTRWTNHGTRPGGSAPIVAGSHVIVAGEDGRVRALDAVDGLDRWSIFLAEEAILPPVVVGQRLVVLTSLGFAFAFGPGAADATPTVDLDASGLRCLPPRLAPDPLPTGEPPARFAPFFDETVGTHESILLASVPDGPPALQDVQTQIRGSLTAMAECGRPGLERELGGFFSDDYYRQDAIVQEQLYDGMKVASGLPSDTRTLADPTRTVVLPDGRVGWLVMPEDPAAPGLLLIFAEQDGWWLIDEVWHVQREAGPLCC